MAYILGSNKILSIRLLPTDPWLPLGCLTSNSIAETVEMLSTTTADNDGWETSVPGFQSYTIPFAGVQGIPSVSTFNLQQINSFKQIKRAGTRIYWKIEDVANGIIEVGEGYITEISDTADAGSFATYEGVITGYGKPVDYNDTTPPSSPVLSPLTQDGEKIMLSWAASTDDVGVVGYNIYRDDVLFDSVSGTDLAYDDFSVLNGFKYSYNVSAFDSSGNESPLSNKRISETVTKPGQVYLEFESGAGVLLKESDGSPLLLESST